MTSYSCFDGEDAINVYLRIKPEEGDPNDNRKCFKVFDKKSLRVTIPPESYHYKNNPRYHDFCDFQFSHIFPEDVTQKNVFESVESVMKNFIDGVDGLIFNYGVTNSGKTYTLVGPTNDPGLFPRTLSYVFRRMNSRNIIEKQTFTPHMYNSVLDLTDDGIKAEDRLRKEILSQCEGPINEARSEITFSTPERNKEDSQTSLDASSLEENCAFFISIAQIYNESIFDLLSSSSGAQAPNTPQKSNSLKIREDSSGNSYIDGLRYVMVSTLQQALTVLRHGCKKRIMAETKMNISSSRSHVIYSLKMVRSFQLPNNRQMQRVNELRFVDLAGSERQAKTLSYGKNLKEASHINLSLMVLGKCIKQLRSQRINPKIQTVVSFRESKLTKLLQSFFVGQLSAVMVVNISPTIAGFDETFNVLRFSALTKSALTRPVGIDFTQTVATEEVLRMDADGDLQSYKKEELMKFVVVLKQRIQMLEEDGDVREDLLREEFNELLQSQLKELTTMNERRVKDECWNIETTYRTKIQILLDQITELQQLQQSKTQESQTVAASYKEFNEELEMKSKRLTVEVENARSELERIRCCLDETEAEHQKLRTEYDAVQIECKKLKASLLQSEDQLETLRTEKEDLIEESSQSQKFYENATSDLKHENTLLREKLNESEAQVEELKTTISDIEVSLKSLRDEKSSLLKKVEERDSKIALMIKNEVENTEKSHSTRGLSEVSLNSNNRRNEEENASIEQLKIYKKLYEENNETIAKLQDYINKLNHDQVSGSSRTSKKRRTVSIATDDDDIPSVRKSVRLRGKKAE